MKHLEEEGVRVTEVIGVGGISQKSAYVMQTLSTIMGVPIKVASTREAGAFGVAMCAAVAGRVYNSLEEAQVALGQGVHAIYQPDPKKQAMYNEKYSGKTALIIGSEGSGMRRLVRENCDKIISILEENLINDIEELRNEENLFLIRFYFDFDKDVLDAAKSYANETSDFEEQSIEWYKESLLPYLYDYGNDEVLDIIEEIVEELDISGEVMAMQIDPSNYEAMEFFALFTDYTNDISIEDLVKDYIIK